MAQPITVYYLCHVVTFCILSRCCLLVFVSTDPCSVKMLRSLTFLSDINCLSLLSLSLCLGKIPRREHRLIWCHIYLRTSLSVTFTRRCHTSTVNLAYSRTLSGVLSRSDSHHHSCIQSAFYLGSIQR